jgi:hypothetical protein
MPNNRNFDQEDLVKQTAARINLSKQLEGFETIDLNDGPTPQTTSPQESTLQGQNIQILEAIKTNDHKKLAEYTQNPEYSQAFQRSGAGFLQVAQANDLALKDSALEPKAKDKARATNLSITNILEDINTANISEGFDITKPLEDTKPKTFGERVKLFFTSIADSIKNAFSTKKTEETTPLLKNNSQKNYNTFSKQTSVNPSKEQKTSVNTSKNQQKNKETMKEVRQTLKKQTKDLQNADLKIGSHRETPSTGKISSQEKGRL